MDRIPGFKRLRVPGARRAFKMKVETFTDRDV
jgi:hypothetical protein